MYGGEGVVAIHQNLANSGSDVFDDAPAWETNELPGLVTHNLDVIFADLNRLGSQSIITTGYASAMPSHITTLVFLDDSDPRPCPVEHLTISSVSDHPHLDWEARQESDMHYGDALYRVYRMLTQNSAPQEDDTFLPLATVPHTVNSFTDDEITLHQQTYNVRAFYMVRAQDDGAHESLNSDTVNCVGLYHPGSVGDPETVSNVLMPVEFSYAVSPNPFNPAATINFTLPQAAHMSLSVYDLNGRLVSELLNGLREAGQHQVTFDGSNLSSGVYLYTLQAGSYSATGKMVLMK